MPSASQSLAALRADLAKRVARDGPDVSQVAVDRDLWCHAQSVAAVSLRALADRTGEAFVGRMGDGADAEALAMLSVIGKVRLGGAAS